MKLIVGLGNPGAEYAGTRHNVGFEVIDVLAKRHNVAVTKRNFKAVYGEGMIGEEKTLLVRPMTFMNLSGEAVSAIARFYKIETPDIFIVSGRYCPSSRATATALQRLVGRSERTGQHHPAFEHAGSATYTDRRGGSAARRHARPCAVEIP